MVVRSSRVLRWAQHTGIDLRELDDALAAWLVQAAWAFGSTVRGDDTTSSDIDIAVIRVQYGSGPTHPPKAFPVAARLPIEWHSLPVLPASLQAEVVATGIVLFEDHPGKAERIVSEVLAAWQRDEPARAARRAAELAEARPLT